MPLLSNPFDHADAVRAREAQADPLVQYLVVRRERASSLPILLASAARAVLSARRFATDPAYAADYAAWQAGSFRKVTLRANERDWAKLIDQFELTTEPAAGPLVAALPPRRRSAVEKFLSKLQAYVIDPAELSQTVPTLDPARSTLLLASNPELTMSAGKLLAQVAHATLLAADAVHKLNAGADWASALRDWEADGHTVRVISPSISGWRQSLADADGVLVRDSGLTELTPGSQTVLALRPAAGAELLAAEATLRA